MDVVSLFEKFMRPTQELIAVKYFSARPDNPDKNARQYSFFQANKENPKFKLILGKFLRKEITCYNCGNAIQLARFESRFKQSVMPDVVHLKAQDFDLTILVKWKAFQPCLCN